MYTKEVRKLLHMPRERYRLREDSKDLKFIPQSDPGIEAPYNNWKERKKRKDLQKSDF